MMKMLVHHQSIEAEVEENEAKEAHNRKNKKF